MDRHQADAPGRTAVRLTFDRSIGRVPSKTVSRPQAKRSSNASPLTFAQTANVSGEAQPFDGRRLPRSQRSMPMALRPCHAPEAAGR